jgi:4-diphosphocytidyl-2-C-methyl-D-erythritol kinase
LDNLTLQSPAKLNLWLEILGKRDDGFHEIKTVFHKISLYDTIRLSLLPRGNIIVTADDPAVPTDATNLAYRAAALLTEDRKLATGVAIHIKKKIPAGAGLGGGSSNAATTLVGLNKLLHLNLSGQDLQNLSKNIGADVPFFVSNFATSRASGIGEILTPLRLSQRLWFLIVFPGFAVSTSWAYGAYDAYTLLTNKKNNHKIYYFSRSFDDVVSLLLNDFEPVVVSHHPEIKAIKESLLQAGASGALLSGSGSSVFGVFATRQAAERAKPVLAQRESHRVFLAHSLD